MHMYKALLFAIALSQGSPVRADDGDGFEQRQKLFLKANVLDTAQTCYILTSGRGYETNPIYGRNPSCLKVIAIKTAFVVAHDYIVREVARRDPKAAKIFQYVSIAGYAGVISANFTIVF